MKFVLPLSTLYMVASLFATVEAVPSATRSLRGSDTTATKDPRVCLTAYGAENIPLKEMTIEAVCRCYACDSVLKLPSDTNMQDLVEGFLENPDEYCEKNPALCPRSTWNGEISMQCWDTSEVKSFAWTFQNQKEFNESLGCWDTSSAEDMNGMFLNARAFNQDVSHFDVSKVTTMNNMFRHATSFNQNISNWDVSNVERMFKMFYIAEDFNQCLSSWGNLVADDVDKTNMLINTKCPITTITVHGDDRMKPWCCN